MCWITALGANHNMRGNELLGGGLLSLSLRVLFRLLTTNKVVARVRCGLIDVQNNVIHPQPVGNWVQNMCFQTVYTNKRDNLEALATPGGNISVTCTS